MTQDTSDSDLVDIGSKAGASGTKTRFESVLLQMRELILTGELAPGSRVHEQVLAERLNVSRTPVRLSLTVLEQEGLVRGEPNRGFTVREFTIDEVLSAYEVRSALEGFACRLIAERGLTAEIEQRLDDCISEGRRLLSRGFFDASAVRAWSDLNGRFHGTMIAATGNSPLAGAYQLVNRHPLAAPHSMAFRATNLDRFFENMQAAQREHAAVVDALRKRESGRAAALMTEHIYQSREIIGEELRGLGTSLPSVLRGALLQKKA
jgi:GntR family transcriptional regulator of vanillate catabolism